MNSMETNLGLQGATAIEDKLQQSVPWAIDYFVKAGILRSHFHELVHHV